MLKCTTVTLVVILHIASASSHSHEEELRLHFEHTMYISHFMCHTPQPRVIPISQLFSETQTHGKAFFPDVTVLHRCDEGTGCCTSGQKCVHSRSNSVELPFKVTYLQEMDGHKKGSWAMEFHNFDNHTECACEHYETEVDLPEGVARVEPAPETTTTDYLSDLLSNPT